MSTANYAAGALPAPKPVAITALAGAPSAVTALYHKHREEQLEAGKSDPESHAHGLRMIRLAGWYRGKGGKWKRLTDDLRDKVNVREAVAQPDGRFVIQDVDTFYPNAVKDADLKFSPGDVEEIIRNTNRSIAAGGQKPGLVEVHPTAELKARGVQLDCYGSGVNWRESPRGKGWARCDLVDVDPKMVDRWRDRRLTGLSVGIAKDAGGTNRRFGHIAALGGESQALSHLPATEIYSFTNQVCFSADLPTLSRGKRMQPNFKKDMAACYGALHAAYSSMEQGEPGAEDKLKEAMQKYSSAQSTYASDLAELGGIHNDTVHGEPDKKNFAGEEIAAEDAPRLDQPPPQAVAEQPAGAGAYSGNAIDFATNPEEAFSALRSEHEGAKRENATLRTHVTELTKTVNGLTGKMVRDDFFSFVDELKRGGTQLPPQEDIEAMYSVCTSTKEPKKSLTTYRSQLSKLPKTAQLSEINVFAANDGQSASAKATSDKDIKESLARVREHINFSDEDVALGTA